MSVSWAALMVNERSNPTGSRSLLRSTKSCSTGTPTVPSACPLSGHGKQGEKASQFVIENLPTFLSDQAEFQDKPAEALKKGFVLVGLPPRVSHRISSHLSVSDLVAHHAHCAPGDTHPRFRACLAG